MKTSLLSLAILLSLSSSAFASGAAVYMCSGFEPGTNGDLSKQAVSFSLISAQDQTTVTILNKSREDVNPATATLIVEAGDCKFDMIPDQEYPAYRISISGTCGTKAKQNIKGICFFE